MTMTNAACALCGRRRDTLLGNLCQWCRARRKAEGKHTRPQRRGPVKVHESRMLQLLTRDGFACGLCNKPLDSKPVLDYKDRERKAVLGNLQLVHKGCRQVAWNVQSS